MPSETRFSDGLFHFSIGMLEHRQTIIGAGCRSSICMYRFRYRYQSAAGANTESFINNDFIGQPNLRFADNGIDSMRMMMRIEDHDTLL